MSLRWTSVALRHLVRIEAYLSAHDDRAARRIVGRIESAAALIASHPHLGRAGRVAGTREHKIVGTRYIVVYRIGTGGIDILALVHERRNRPTSL